MVLYNDTPITLPTSDMGQLWHNIFFIDNALCLVAFVLWLQSFTIMLVKHLLTLAIM